MNAADLVIAELSAYTAQLEHDVTVNREMVRAALSRLAASDQQQRDLQARFDALKDELRRYVAARVA